MPRRGPLRLIVREGTGGGAGLPSGSRGVASQEIRLAVGSGWRPRSVSTAGVCMSMVRGPGPQPPSALLRQRQGADGSF